jgi:hypothetical protein
MPKPKLTARQVLLMKSLAKGATLGEAATAAGYAADSNGDARQSGYQALQLAKRKVPEIMELYGLGPASLIDKYLRPALEAEETKFFQKDGTVTEEREVIAWGPRLTALDLALEISGAYPVNGKNGNGHVVNVQINTNVTVPAP